MGHGAWSMGHGDRRKETGNRRKETGEEIWKFEDEGLSNCGLPSKLFKGSDPVRVNQQ
jgi:hypothetical protein